MAPLQPFLLKTADNSQGVDGSVFEDIQKAILSDRPAFLKSFLDNFYNVDRLRGRRISDEAWQASFNVSVAASAKGTFDCVSAWQTDFREDLPKLDVPLLIVQGDEDRILPYAATGKRLASLVEAELVVVKGGPHAIGWTHADEVNGALMPFLRRYTSPVLGERRPSTEGAPTVH
jgi:non-heme chloroperoxidase